jgi:S-adenosyl-L-methionine hydrolase (adenosine-forming)
VTRIVLLTDFGTADGYAAAMAGVVVSAAPDVTVDHAAHDIAPGDILGAAVALFRYALRYPAGTVHLVVVDPGVGSGRRAMAATVDGRYFVGPDNGVFSLVLQGAERVRLVSVERVGLGPDAAPTFHGRDIFAPAAAHLARGESIADLGPPIHDPVLLDLPSPSRDGDGARGRVIHVDRFGSLVTNIPAAWARRPGSSGDPTGRVRVAGVDVGSIWRTYADVAPGQLVALIGSLSTVEVSVRDGSGGGGGGGGGGGNTLPFPFFPPPPRHGGVVV